METKTKHTLGPWTATTIKNSYGTMVRVCNESNTICRLPFMKDANQPLADARLIAAAPELLAFARKVVEDLSLELDQTDQATGQTYYDQGMSAIAKARGE